MFSIYKFPKISLYIIFLIYNFLIIFYSPLCLSNDDNYNNRIIEQKDNLNQIQKQIKTLKNDLTNKENDKNLTANKISESTEKINSLQQKLQELNAKYQQKSKQLNKLKNNIKTLDKTLKNNKKLLSNLLYWKYLNIQQTNIVTFEKSNNLQNFKNSYYLQQIIQSQNNLLKATQKDLITRQNLAVNLSNEQQNLEKIRQTQNSYKEELQQQKLSHQRRFDELDKQVNLQKQKIQTLKEDEKNLTKLVEKLTKIAEEQKRQRELAKAKAKAKAQKEKLEKEQQKNNKKTLPNDDKNIVINNVTNNAKNLILPVAGKVITSFGQKKSDGIISKGVTISAKIGDNVKAIADGKIVFADEMRGFGNLLVIDHQNSYMTVYAHNDEILVSLNQTVQAQQNIGKVGESGVVYFELRKQGKAVNPRERMR